MIVLTLLTRPGCHLCDVMKNIVTTVQSQHPFELTEIDISNHPEFERRFGVEIPTLLHGDHVLARYRLSATQLLEKLARVD